MTTNYWCNGVAQADGLDRGLQYGDGHFTTLRVKAGKPLWWSFHQARLIRANTQLLFPELEPTQLQQQLNAVIQDGDNCVLKIIISRGQGGRGYLPAINAEPNIYLLKSPLPPPQQAIERIAVADLKLARQPRLAGLKTLNRLEQVLLAEEKRQQQVDELLVLDQQNHLIEGCQGNLFWRKGGTWYTPSIEASGIDGVARQVILANNWLGRVEVGDFPLAAIANAEQAFVCNSVRGAVPITRLNGKVLATSTPPGLDALIT